MLYTKGRIWHGDNLDYWTWTQTNLTDNIRLPSKKNKSLCVPGHVLHLGTQKCEQIKMPGWNPAENENIFEQNSSKLLRGKR